MANKKNTLEILLHHHPRVGHFLFKRLNGNYLLTNDMGDFTLLSPLHFVSFLRHSLDGISEEKVTELIDKGFLRNRNSLSQLTRRYTLKNNFLFQSTTLHIIVVTLRCDHACVYCQASALNSPPGEFDMDFSVAKFTVDRIFEAPNKNITIEFQGGEPLLNFDVVKHIVHYAKEKNKKSKKNIAFTLVTNLNAMNEEILSFCIQQKVHICSSLDGPRLLHDRIRRSTTGHSTYDKTVFWLRRIREAYEKNYSDFHIAALPTITKYSLKFARDIVDEYIKLGISDIHLRPMSPFGGKGKQLSKLRITSQEFIHFYKLSLNYIIKKNFDGAYIKERYATILLTKILTEKDPNFLDIRSPCGAGIGQLAYNFNGDVYTCDEARMLSRLGDESFRVGNVVTSRYQKIVDTQVVKTMCVASCLDNLPECSQCVYKPYCGVCPVCNHFLEGNIFAKDSFQCKTRMAILDYLFHKLQDQKAKDVFYRWVSSSPEARLA